MYNGLLASLNRAFVFSTYTQGRIKALEALAHWEKMRPLPNF